ncbi:MAG TPA: alpha/beta hydrolase [Candidatus Aquabacterium excrementipullorum]|nr:alpha/beta hydrolase [Candidatus Aquabacterium excrementipullorum]
MDANTAYSPTHQPQSSFLQIRGLRKHLLRWGDPAKATPEAPLLVMVHGWMDVAASFQFAVDALRARPGWQDRPIIALDWRGFGQSDASGADSYWFADYLADLDFVLDELSPGQPIDLLGHSMGGNAVMLYAGLRPQRIRRLINVEGFGMPAAEPEEAPARFEKWIDELKQPARLKDYPNLAGVAERLKANNPRLREDFALWLAGHWSHQEGGRFVISADPAHKRPQPLLYRLPEVLAFFRRITAPVLFIEGEQTMYFFLFNGKYDRAQFEERAKAVPDFRIQTIQNAGHMVHHDQPEALAALVADFLQAP